MICIYTYVCIHIDVNTYTHVYIFLKLILAGIRKNMGKKYLPNYLKCYSGWWSGVIDL